MATETRSPDSLNTSLLRNQFEVEYLRLRSVPKRREETVDKYKRLGVSDQTVAEVRAIAARLDSSEYLKNQAVKSRGIQMTAENAPVVARHKLIAELKNKRLK